MLLSTASSSALSVGITPPLYRAISEAMLLAPVISSCLSTVYWLKSCIQVSVSRSSRYPERISRVMVLVEPMVRVTLSMSIFAGMDCETIISSSVSMIIFPSSCIPMTQSMVRARRIGMGFFAIFTATPPSSLSYRAMKEPVLPEETCGSWSHPSQSS